MSAARIFSRICGPFVALSEVGLDSEGHVVVDHADRLALDVELLEMPDDDVHQSLRVRRSGDFLSVQLSSTALSFTWMGSFVEWGY